MKSSVTTKIPWILGTGIVLGLVAYGLIPAAVEVEMATVRQGALVLTVDDDGETRVRDRYIVSAPVSGNMQRLELHAGDAVIRGQTLLATINANPPSLLDARETSELEARVRAALASVERSNALLVTAKESLEIAQHDYDRASELIKTRSISQADFDLAEHQHHIATANVRAAEFAVQVAEYERDVALASLQSHAGNESNTEKPVRLVSPIDGKVLRILHEDSGPIASGTELLSIGDPHELEMQIDILSQEAVRIQPNAKILVEQWGKENPLHGRVRLVEPYAYLKVSALGVEEKRVNVIGDFTDAKEDYRTLGDGFRIEVKIVVEETSEDSLLIPSGSLFRENGFWSVYRIVDGRAQLAQVEVGANNGVEAHVLRGLKLGDSVIRFPTDKIRDGVRVRIRVR